MNYYLTDKKCKIIKSRLFDSFPELVSGCSTRLGGVSCGIHESMNLAFNNGDEPEKVLENYKIIANELDIDYKKIVVSKQTHKNKIRLVTEKDCGKGVILERDYDDIDALICNIPGITLAILTADCVPVTFYDPVTRSIAAAHSGWRGTVGEITLETIKQMTECFGSKPSDIYLTTGPCICRNCYEISEEVAEEFRKVYNDTKEFLYDGKVPGKYQLDLTAAIRLSALKAGLLPEHMEIQGLCTACNRDLLWSHRATAGKRGTMATFIGLK